MGYARGQVGKDTGLAIASQNARSGMFAQLSNRRIISLPRQIQTYSIALLVSVTRPSSSPSHFGPNRISNLYNTTWAPKSRATFACWKSWRREKRVSEPVHTNLSVFDQRSKEQQVIHSCGKLIHIHRSLLLRTR